MKFLFFLFIPILIITQSCKFKKDSTIDFKNIEVNYDILRFENDLYGNDSLELRELKAKYHFLIDNQTEDSIWTLKKKDTIEVDMYNKSKLIYNNEYLRGTIDDVFKRVKFFDNQWREPKVVTLISNFDYKNKVIYSSDYLFISLDLYLDSDNVYYSGFPEYISNGFGKEFLIRDIAFEISSNYRSNDNSRDFISKIVREGKKIHYIDQLFPEMSDLKKIGYIEKELEWVENSEKFIWEYFIKNKYLYSTDLKLDERFIRTAPFSKFYLSIDNQSPGRIGIWLGWQIVKSYAENNESNLLDLMRMNPLELFKKSNYKPKNK